MSFEENLQLNLTTTTNENPGTKRKNETESEAFENEQPIKKKKVKDQSGTNKKQEPEGPFISSLFNNNPKIPKLELDSGESSKKEAVFSQKALEDGGVHPYIAQTLRNLGMETLTLVQSLSLPLISAGFDCLIKSQTGSGKTLAYGIPLVQQLALIQPKIQRAQGTYAIIICPTRELVVQSYEWFSKLCYSFKWLVPGMLIGGEKRKSEKARVRKGITILIATPGRLIDHITKTKCLSLKNIQWLVFDECDRMLELGYKRDVQSVLNAINEQSEKKRQTLLLSATLTQGIEEMSSISLKHPKFIDAATVESKEEEEIESLKVLTTPENLQQTFTIVPAKLRLVVLASFILWKSRFSKPRKLLVFMATQDMVDFHCELFDRCINNSDDKEDDHDQNDFEMSKDALDTTNSDSKFETKSMVHPSRRPLKLLKLHGSMQQKDRIKIVEDVKKSEYCVLFCTDVAARGLDLPLVDWIVQYNPPTTTADYVHRVGRTARIGAKGSSLIFMLPSEANFVKELESNNMTMLELTGERVLEKLYDNAEVSKKTGKLPHTVEEAATDLQMNFENAIANDKGLHELGSQAYVSFVRSYASFPKDVRHIFSFKALHLGHIAKCFGLRDPPSQITGIGKGNWVKKEAQKKSDLYRDQKEAQKKSDLKREQKVIQAQEIRINQKSLVMSEYSSGFDGINLEQSGKKESKKSITKKKLKRLK